MLGVLLGELFFFTVGNGFFSARGGTRGSKTVKRLFENQMIYFRGLKQLRHKLFGHVKLNLLY